MCHGTGRCTLPQWDPGRFIFNDVDLGPCFNCNGAGYVGTIELTTTDNTGDW